MSGVKQLSNRKRARSGKVLLGVVVILAMVNIAAWFFHAQADLTADKRYTLTPATRRMLGSLDRNVEVQVFLEGNDLPAAFKNLSESTADLLRHFRDLSGNRVSYRIIDPLGDDTTALATLANYRMRGMPVTVSAGKRGTTQKMIFPWALVVSSGPDGAQNAFPVFLQETNTLNLNRKTLLRSEMLLEYNLANGIRQVIKPQKAVIRYITGHGEALGDHIVAASAALSAYYDIDTFNLQENASLPSSVQAVIINSPARAFSETDKFKIDQYVMNGGNVFWCLDMVSGTLDSLAATGRYNAMPLDLNLSDLLFHYGVRVNTNVIEDAVNNVEIPLQASGNNAEPSMFPWVCFPVLMPASDHPVVKNLNGVLGRIVSSIDTNSNDAAIMKTVLLASGKYSRAEAAPLPLILESAIVQPDPALFRQQYLIASVLLEGKFTSAYRQRRPLEVAAFIDSLKFAFKAEAEQPGKMIVTGDGDMLFNEVSQKNGPSDLGVFRFSNYLFDNKSFLLNSLEYLTDPNNLLEARVKTYDTRVLDPRTVQERRRSMQWLNIGVPVCIVLLLGAVFFFVRRERYG